MARKRWVFKQTNKELAKALAAECDVDPMVALLLSARGLDDPYDIDSFIHCEQQLSDPFELPDMDLAVERIQLAMQRRERIAVCGDYDADGVTASALLYSYLSDKGCPVICEIPERLEEGYGLHRSNVDRLKELEISLIITVDNGISCIDEIEYANSLGIDVVVTDHHRPGAVLPPAVAVVDPHVDGYYGFTDYAGVGVAFKLACALEGCACEELMPYYGDLVAIGTVADVVPLIDENRIMVQTGLQVLNRLERIGLRELVEAADIAVDPIGADQISYAIAPRINAAGRMGESFRAFCLLTTEDIDQARYLAGEICQENIRRQDVEGVVSDVCRIQLYESGIHFYDRVIVLADENLHHGVLGIVAARLCAQFGKPTIVLSIDGDIAKGSARSVEGFDIFEALTACSDCLIQCGGHVLAAGLTIKTEHINLFRQRINEYARQKGPRPVPQLSIDCKLSPYGADEKTASAIRCMAPHGCQNPVPVFSLLNMELAAVQPVGGGRSRRLVLSRDGVTVVCMKFGITDAGFPFRNGDKIDLALVYRYTTYKNKPAFSLVVQDIRPSDFDHDGMFRDMLCFERLMANEPTTKEERLSLIPTREEMGHVFRYLRCNPNLVITPDVMLWRIGSTLTAGKLFVTLKVFEEYNFCNYYFDGDNLHITFLNPTGKVDLSNSEFLLKLQS